MNKKIKDQKMVAAYLTKFITKNDIAIQLSEFSCKCVLTTSKRYFLLS